MKNSFILYCDNYEAIKDLTNEEKGQLLDAIFVYSMTNVVQELNPVIKMAFGFIKQSLDRDRKKWEEEIKKRQESGRKGGLARANKAKQTQGVLRSAKQTQANQADSVSVSVNVNDKNYSNKDYLLNIPLSDLEQISKDIGIGIKEITFKGKQLFDWCEAKGKSYKNYKAFLKTCLRGDTKKDTPVNFLKGGIRYEELGGNL